MKKILIIFSSICLSLAAMGQSVKQFEYDNLNRLTKVTYANGAVVQYTYDALGNRLTKTITGVSVNYTIIATASPSNGGAVNGAGSFQEGSTCNLTAMAYSGYTFINWTENNIQVSSNANYSFTVTANRTLVAHFEQVLPDNCIITASASPEEGGTVSGTGTYTQGSNCTLTASPNLGYTFTNWTKNGQVVSNSNSYSFTVTENATFVANFAAQGSNYITQTTALPVGWTWWSSYVEMSGNNGLTQMEESLGNNGIMIKSQANGFVTNSFGAWYGSLNSINNESTYLIQTSGACQMSVTGSEAVASSHSITLPTGWTWIGYPCSTSMSVTTAMSGLMPVANDQLKSQNVFAMYTPGIGWLGSLQTITPGMGLMFESHSNSTVTLTYPNSAKSEELKENITIRDNHWRPELQSYPDNMTMVAVVEMDGVELQGEYFELGAFANGECRGSAKLMRIDALNRYMAFLTVYGDSPDEIFFGLYNGKENDENYDSNEKIVFEANASEGNPMEPYVIRFSGITGFNELNKEIKVYPNPVERGQMLNIGMAEESSDIQITIINAMGIEIGHEVSQETPAKVKAPSTSGVYMLRITVEGKGICYRKLIVK